MVRQTDISFNKALLYLRCRHLVGIFTLSVSLCLMGVAQVSVGSPRAFSSFDASTYGMTLDQLLNLKVSVASKKEEDVFDAPGVVSVISRQEIEGYAARNLGEILNKIAGAVLLSPDVFTEQSLVMRGQALTPYNNHVLILLNGRPLRDPISGGMNSPVYAGFPVDIIDRIEVIRGPGSVLYGSTAYAGVISIITKAVGVDDIETNVTLEAASNGGLGQNVNTGFVTDLISGRFALRHFEDDGPEYKFYDYGGTLSSDEFSREVNSFVSVLEVKDLSLNIFYSEFVPYSLNGREEIWQQPPANGATEEFVNDHVSSFADLAYDYQFSDELRLEANATYNKHNWRGADGDGDAESFLYELAFNGSIDRFAYVIGGGVEQNEWETSLRLVAGELDTNFAYGQVDLKLDGNLKFILGAQNNKIEGIDHHVSKRIGVIKHFNENVGLKILSSDAFRKGYPLETSFGSFVFIGNLALEPEKIHTNELQFFYNNDKSESSITFFESEITDLITRIRTAEPLLSPPFRFQYVNDGTWDYKGFEIESKYKLMDTLLIMGSLSYQSNERGSDGYEDAALHPNEMYKMGALYETQKANYGVFLQHIGAATPADEVSSSSQALNREPESYDLLSLKISSNLARLFDRESLKKFAVSLEGENLLGDEIVYVDYPNKQLNSFQPLADGASYKAQITYQF